MFAFWHRILLNLSITSKTETDRQVGFTIGSALSK